jgi:hypothetical protein
MATRLVRLVLRRCGGRSRFSQFPDLSRRTRPCKRMDGGTPRPTRRRSAATGFAEGDFGEVWKNTPIAPSPIASIASIASIAIEPVLACLASAGLRPAQIPPCRAATSKKPSRRTSSRRRHKRVSATGPTRAKQVGDGRAAGPVDPSRTDSSSLHQYEASAIADRSPIGSAVHLPHGPATTSAPRLRLRSSAYRLLRRSLNPS